MRSCDKCGQTILITRLEEKVYKVFDGYKAFEDVFNGVSNAFEYLDDHGPDMYIIFRQQEYEKILYEEYWLDV